MSEPVYRSALADAKPIRGSITIAMIDDRGMIDLRGDISDKKFVAAATKALGFTLPTTPRQSTNKNGIVALWLSPDQWLITCPRDHTAATLKKLQTSLAKLHSHAVDVSDARSIIRLEGDGSKVVLMKGAPVDLTTPEHTAGFVRRIQFAELAGLVHVVSSKPETIDLYVFRSYTQHAWDWLAATSGDQSRLHLYGVQETADV